MIYLDGRALPLDDEDRIPTYFGYSAGVWQGDTLVVESEGYNEKFWFHRGGLPHTDALHLTERFTRPDYDTLKYEVTVNDPKALLMDSASAPVGSPPPLGDISIQNAE